MPKTDSENNSLNGIIHEETDIAASTRSSNSDILVDSELLDAKIRKGIAEYEQGHVHRMNADESMDDFLGRMINED